MSTEADLIARVRRLAVVTAGPGMGATIRGEELRAVLGRLDALEAAAEKKPAKGKQAAADWTHELPAMIAAVADILEGSPELWGTTLLDALDAWAAQKETVISPEARAAVEKALAGGS